MLAKSSQLVTTVFTPSAPLPSGEGIYPSVPLYQPLYTDPACLAGLKRLVRLAAVAMRASAAMLVFLVPDPVVACSFGLSEGSVPDLKFVLSVARQAQPILGTIADAEFASAAGIPLGPRGMAGVLTVADRTPRQWTGDDRQTLEDLGMAVTAFLDGHAATDEAARHARDKAAILDRITDACVSLDSQWRFTYLNRQAEQLFERLGSANDKPLTGLVLWDVVPESRDTIFWHEFQRALRTRIRVAFEAYITPLKTWLEVRAYPSQEGLFVYFADITERRQRIEQVRAEREVLAGVLHQMPAAVLVQSPGGDSILANTRFEELMGSPAGLQGTKPDGQPYAPEEWPWRRTLEHGEVVMGEVIDFLTPQGRPATARVSSSPVRDSQGNIVAGVATIFDVTEQKALERRLLEEAHVAETQHRVGQSLVAELDFERLVQAVTDEATRLCGAEFGAFFYSEASPTGEILQLYSLSGAPKNKFSHFGNPRNQGLFAPTFKDQVAIRLADVSSDSRYHQLPAGHLPVKSYMAIPVVTNSGVIQGALMFAHSQPGVFSERDERVILSVASQASVAFENARLYREAHQARARLADALEQERRILTTVAESFLGRQPELPGLDIACLYRPANRAERMGGDFYDFIPLSESRLGIVIGDVCGKGISAGVFTATTKYILRAYAMEDSQPDLVLCRLNQALCQEMTDDGRFVTLFFGVLDMSTRTLLYASAGHTCPVLHRAGHTRLLEPTGPILGAFPDLDFGQSLVSLDSPDATTLAFFTDGISEAGARSGGQAWGESGVASQVESLQEHSAAQLAEAIYSEAKSAGAGELSDDVALVIIKIQGEGEAARKVFK